MLYLLALLSLATGSPNCLSETGTNVDWFFAIKGSNTYEYYIATSRSKKLVKSQFSLDDPDKGAVSLTLAQSYDKNMSSLYWNDQSPDMSQHNTFGHTKGVISFDQAAGYWLVHSVPRFPNEGDSYTGYPDYALVYAQSFFCVSVSNPTLNEVAKLLQWYRPFIHSQRLIDAHIKKLPELTALSTGAQVKDPTSRTTSFKSKGGKTFVGIGTAAAYNADIYYQGVAQYFKDNVFANTWMNGIGAMESYCQPEHSYDVRNVRQLAIEGATWRGSQDHSKWAYTETHPNVCIGGKNRQVSQTRRQGGIICFEDSTLHASLSAVVADSDTCKQQTNRSHH